MPSICSRCRQPGLDGNWVLYCIQCGGRMLVTTPKIEVKPAETQAFDPQSSDRILRHLGSGSMGDVYEVERAVSGDRVAVKYLTARLVADRDALEAFREEARIARSLNQPRCVKVLAFEENPPRIVMELMPGRTLKDTVAQSGPLPVPVAVKYGLDLIAGLMAVHQLGVIHRDVKPGNCFLTQDDRVKLGDFGLSSKFEESASDPPIGTVLFAPPEQLRGETVAFDSDQYSACATIYYLLSGKAPHEATSLTASLARAMSEPAPPLRSKGVNVAPALERAVLKGLARDREGRWPELELLQRALERHVGEESDQPKGRWWNRLFGR